MLCVVLACDSLPARALHPLMMLSFCFQVELGYSAKHLDKLFDIQIGDLFAGHEHTSSVPKPGGKMSKTLGSKPRHGVTLNVEKMVMDFFFII